MTRHLKCVYKYFLLNASTQRVKLPIGAQILCVQMQHGDIQLWALVDPSASTEERTIRIHGTGHDIDGAERLRYIGTVQIDDGFLIFHVFEETTCQ